MHRYKYIPNKNYTVQYEKGLLILNAGADQLYAIEDVTEEVANETIKSWQSALIDPATISEEIKPVFDQLLSAGLIQVKDTANKGSSFNIAIEFHGTKIKELEQLIKKELDARKIPSQDQEPTNLNLLIRTNTNLTSLSSKDYLSLDSPHLLLDLAYHHTFSIGPLVYPGETACLGCLVGRLNSYWGDADPPARPAMTDNIRLAALLIALEIEKISQGDQSLINQTLSYDFQNREVKTNKIYKLPWCPICQSRKPIANIGYVELPWNK